MPLGLLPPLCPSSVFLQAAGHYLRNWCHQGTRFPSRVVTIADFVGGTVNVDRLGLAIAFMANLLRGHVVRFGKGCPILCNYARIPETLRFISHPFPDEVEVVIPQVGHVVQGSAIPPEVVYSGIFFPHREDSHLWQSCHA